jgi:hypothetical protein
MPKPDLETILAVLDTIKDAHGRSAAHCLKPRLGTLKPTPKEPPCASAEEAWTAFAQFGGPGWLQNAHTQEILHWEGPALTAPLDARHWPVAGERVSADGKSSLHLRRAADGWVITTFEETASAEHLLLTQRLLSTDLKHYLVYDVAYRPEEINGHKEFRPFASRFVGFKPVETESPSAAKAKPSAP